MRREDIKFLQKCERHRIIPRFIEKGLRVRNDNRGARKAVWEGRRIWLKFEVKEHYGRLHTDRREMYNLQMYLCKNLSQYEWQCFVREAEEIATYKLIEKKRRLRRKFQKSKFPNRQENNLVGATEPRNFPFVINRSSHDFSYDQLALLNKGLKFRPAPEKIPLDEIVVGIEYSLENRRERTKQWMREELSPLIVQKNLKNAKQWKTIEELKKIDVVFSHPDKGKGVVIIDKKDYYEAMRAHIREGPYELERFRGAFPVENLQEKVKDGLKKLVLEGAISKELKDRLVVSNPRMPRMSGFPKIHKAGNQIRPVVTTLFSPTSKIGDYLVKKFRAYKKFESCSVRNSVELVKRTSDLEINDECEMVSYDVRALFPSVPEAEAVVWLKEWCRGQESSGRGVAAVCGLIDIVVSQKYFQFEGKFYKQLDGVEIGGKISAWVAEITMSRLEMRLLQQPNPPLQIFRYVDDYFCILKKDTAEIFLNRLNDMHPKIQFTYEKEIEKKLPFLDLMISREGGKLSFEVYRKPTDSMLCIPSDSYTPYTYKLAAFGSMFHRLYNIPMNEAAFKKEEEYIFESARMNGYDREAIKKVQMKHQKRKSEPKTTLMREGGNREGFGDRLLMLNYFPPLTDEIQKIAKGAGINFVYKSQGSLGDFLINLKDKRPENSKSGIYRIKCDTCELEYHGQCKRIVQRRWDEHDRAFRLNHPNNSAVAAHCLEEGHTIGEKRLVKEVTSRFELNAWESFFITNSDNSMNEAEPSIRSNLFPLAYYNN